MRAGRHQISETEQRLAVLLESRTLHRAIMARMRFHAESGHDFIISLFQLELTRFLNWPPVSRQVAGAIAIRGDLCVLVFRPRNKVTRILKCRYSLSGLV